MTKFLILASLMLCSTWSYTQSSQEALEYMNNISSEFKMIQGATWDYTKSIAKNKSARKVEKTRLELIKTISSSIVKVKKIKPFDGKTYFRDSTIAFLEMNKSVVAQDYEKIMDLEEIAEQSYDLMEAYMLAQKVAGDRLSQAGESITKTERQFAEENNITLVEGEDDKVTKKLRRASKMYEYYNPVYLIFFKSYKQEIYFLEALSRGDVSGMEQNKSMLAQTAQEGIDLLNEMGDYEGDESLKKACLEMLEFYLDEANNKFAVFVDFQTTKEGFENAKKNIESKKEKDRTQEDIDGYNKVVNEYNAATGEYNNTNNELNKNRSKLINSWNNASAKFTNSHL